MATVSGLKSARISHARLQAALIDDVAGRRMRAIAIWAGLVFFALSVVRSLVFSVRSAGRGEYALVLIGLIFVAVNGW